MQENLLKLVRTLPTVLKFLPSQKAQDARNFVQACLCLHVLYHLIQHTAAGSMSPWYGQGCPQQVCAWL